MWLEIESTVMPIFASKVAWKYRPFSVSRKGGGVKLFHTQESCFTLKLNDVNMASICGTPSDFLFLQY